MKRLIIWRERTGNLLSKETVGKLNKLDTARENGCSLTIIYTNRKLGKNQWRLKIRYVKEWSLQEHPSNNTMEIKPN